MYGFLEFPSQDDASQALTLLKGKPMPNTNSKKFFKLNWASYNSNRNQTSTNEYSIYVCELDQSVTEDELKNFFSQKYQSVLGAKIIIDPITKISKGYGFVKFSDSNESQRAIGEMNGKMIKGRPMKTNKAEFKKNAENKKNNNNYFNNLYNQQNNVMNMQNDQNFILQQQYLNSFLFANVYYPNYPYPFFGYFPQQNQIQDIQQGNTTDQSQNQNQNEDDNNNNKAQNFN